MESNDIYKAINEALRQASGDTLDGLTRSSLAQSISSGLGYDQELSQVPGDLIVEAVSKCPPPYEYYKVKAFIRDYCREQAEIKRQLQNEEQKEKSNGLANWGMFLKSWDTFRKEQDINKLPSLTVHFLGEWLETNEEIITREEAAVCAESAMKSMQGDPADKAYKIELEKRKHGNIVYMAMKKLLITEQHNPEQLKMFIDTKRAEYERYTLETYGEKPAWNT